MDKPPAAPREASGEGLLSSNNNNTATAQLARLQVSAETSCEVHVHRLLDLLLYLRLIQWLASTPPSSS